MVAWQHVSPRNQLEILGCLSRHSQKETNFMGKNILALVAARDILFTWTLREVKVRYVDTSLGLAWIVIYPAAWVLLFTFLFSHLVPVPMQGIPYPLFVMSGLVPGSSSAI
jgi:ABC-type polysaccharide/polyol phosphate export permease